MKWSEGRIGQKFTSTCTCSQPGSKERRKKVGRSSDIGFCAFLYHLVEKKKLLTSRRKEEREREGEKLGAFHIHSLVISIAVKPVSESHLSLSLLSRFD